MPPDPACFARLNLPPTFSAPSCMEYFTLSALPNTNLWRKPEGRDTATAPMLYTTPRHPFVLAEVTISAEWEMEWDQGGLVIFAGAPPGSAVPEIAALTNRWSLPSESRTPQRWVKAGLEFTGGTLSASSVVASGQGADWSLMPLYPQCVPLPSYPLSHSSLRIKLERIGHSLWIWYQQPSNAHHNHYVPPADPNSPESVANSWKKLREITWFFWGVDEKDIHVGVYACRPTNFATLVGGNGSWNGLNDGQAANGLLVEFEDLEIF